MAKIKVKVDLKDLKDLKKFINNADLEIIGQNIVSGSKAFIAKGISPVRGKRRFTAYAAQREEAVSNYPLNKINEFPDKKVRPVNLTLAGGYIDRFTNWVENKSVFVGFRNASQKTVDLYEAHNLGLNTKKAVPERRHLPLVAQDEEFNISIQRQIANDFRKLVDKIIRRINKRS